MDIKDMVAIVRQGAESRSAGITKEVEFTVESDTNNPGGIIIRWVAEYDGNKYGDYIREKGTENLYEAGFLLAEQCLWVLETLREAKQWQANADRV